MARKPSLYDKYLPEFIDLVEGDEGLTQAEASRFLHHKYYEEIPVGQNSFRVKMNQRYVKKLKKDGLYADTDSKGEVNQYTLSKEEFDLVRAIREQAKAQGIGIKNVRGGWLKNKTASLSFTNPLYESKEEQAKEIDFDKIIKKHAKVVKVSPKKIKTEFLFDRFVFTDTHVGMDVNSDGFSLYPGKWDKEEILDTAEQIVEHILTERKSNKIVIDDLGDFMDGWNQETARGGHKLPQNMDNEMAFDVGLEFKMLIANRLAPHFKQIIFHNVCNSNHSGNGFDYVVNSAFKSLVNQMYPHIKVHNYRKFIECYDIDKHYFLISHGKDAHNLKFGFKPNLDDKQAAKITNFIDHLELPRGATIEFSKGDSHQYIFDNSSSNVFNYYNYPALSPPSDYIKTNFSDSARGAVLFNYNKNRKYIKEIIF